MVLVLVGVFCLLVAEDSLSQECKMTRMGTEYAGRIAQTGTGRPCQRWDAQIPHHHSNTKSSAFPDSSLLHAQNFCRNPDREQNGPWCYTIDHGRRWEYCNVPYCSGITTEVLPAETSSRFVQTTGVPTVHSVISEFYSTATNDDPSTVGFTTGASTNDSQDSIPVTVAVVTVCVFLICLTVVVIWLGKRKKRRVSGQETGVHTRDPEQIAKQSSAISQSERERVCQTTAK